MPVVNLRPVSQGTYNSGLTTITGGSATKTEAVDPGPDPIVHTDFTTVGWASGSSGASESFNLANLPAGAAGVSDVTANARFFNNDSIPHTFNVWMRTTSDGAAQSQGVAAFSGTTYSFTSMARPGGGAWVAEDVNNAQIAINISTVPAGGAMNLASFWASVTFSYARSGLMSLVVCVLPGLVGVAVPFSSMRAIAAEVFRRSGVLIDASEYGAVWRELREYRYRRYAF